MDGLWLQDIESLEAISQDEDTRDLFLRMAQLSQDGRLTPFLRELEDDGDLDDVTKVTWPSSPPDAGFLHAVEDYVLRTRERH